MFKQTLDHWLVDVITMTRRLAGHPTPNFNNIAETFAIFYVFVVYSCVSFHLSGSRRTSLLLHHSCHIFRDIDFPLCIGPAEQCCSLSSPHCTDLTLFRSRLVNPARPCGTRTFSPSELRRWGSIFLFFILLVHVDKATIRS